MSLDFEDIRDLREHWEFTRDKAGYQAEITQFLDTMAPGEPGRAELLAALCESIATDDASTEDLERAADLARAAIADGGEITSDPRLGLLRLLHLLGRTDEATTLAKDCLRATSPDHVHGDLHADLGEIMETRGDFSFAHRAYTVGLKEFEPATDEPDFDEDTCLAGRYRVRRALALGFDSLDKAFENYRPDAATAIRERVAASDPI